MSIAGTVLATAGVVFTLLTLPLSTVAAQYGSRLLRLFLGDRTTQLVLGMFVATFVYCIAAALSIPSGDMQPGHYVATGAVLALVWPADQVDGRLEKLMGRAFQIGNGRTPTQDVVYAVNQLTEMAVRAMSPAINDPFTAMTCLDHLGHGLTEFVRQGARSANYYDRDGRLRLLLEPVTFGELLSAAFDMLRHASCDNARVLLHMLEVVALIGQETQAPDARQQLLDHVNLILLESQAGALIEQDRQQILRRGEALRSSLIGTP